MSMKFVPRDYADILYAALDGATDPLADQIVQRFVAWLNRQGHLSRLPLIIREFEKMYNQRHHILKTQVTVTRPLEAQAKDYLVKILERTTRQTVELHQQVNSTIIGGAVIELEDQLLDASVKEQLRQLHQQLTS